VTVLARARFAALAVSVLATAAACLPLSAQENHLHVATNDLRAGAGLPHLIQHDRLVERAREWAATLAAEGRLAHSDLGALGVGWSAAAENVGRSSSIEDITERLIASSPHRANLLSTTFTHTGVGTATARDGTVYAVQLFIRP
jgi:uncharacterized protein YkwD